MNYAAIAEFSAEIVDDAMQGFAAPKTGLLPCVVGLFAGDTAISFARATSFSEATEIRMGWCGFRLPGLAQAVALEGEVQLRCGVTNAVLLRPVVDITTVERKTRIVEQISLTEFLSGVRAQEAFPEIGQLAIFGYEHMRRHGGQSFLFAAYQTLLEREPDAATISSWSSEGLGVDDIETYLADIVESDEFRRQAVKALPGPFQAGFKFDRSLFL